MKINWNALLLILCVVVAAIYATLQVDLKQKTERSLIHVGVLPDESVKQLHLRYGPLLNYLSDETGLKFKLISVSDYNELLNLFLEEKVDLAYLGGFTFLQSLARQDVVPLVMREVDTRFTSYFLVNQKHVATDLKDFKGKVFSFGSQLSTSGHLMPRHFLNTNHQIVPEEFFSDIRYSGAHDKTAYLVRDSEVDLGVANSEIIRSMIKDGRLNDQDIRVIWETPPFPDYVWAVHGHLSEDLRIQLQDAFLALDINDESEKIILSGMGARIFLPAGVNDFQPLKQVAESLQLLPTE